MIFFILLGIVGFLVIRFIKRRKENSHRPLLTCVLDTLCEIPAALKIGPWADVPNVQAALKMAIETTKCTDFGFEDRGFIQRYDVAKKVGLAKSGAKYSPAGFPIIQPVLAERFSSRLLLIDYLKKHPSIGKIQLKSPIFVIGFPRTGTTFLHEMLGLHESVRSHYTWEQMSPVPKTDDESIEAQEADRTQRYNRNKLSFNLAFKGLIHEKIQHIHRIAYDETEECTIPCASELPWALTEIPLMVYAMDELIPLGAGNAFKIYHKFLQLLTWQSKNRRDQDFTWMLKSPFHLPYLEELFDEFPGATVVWTHRDPAEFVASGCSLYETIMEMGMEQSSIDRIKLGRAVMNYTRKCLDKAEETFQKLKSRNIKVIHIRYLDNLKDPKSVCRNIYEKAGLTYTEKYEQNLDSYLKKSKEERQKLKEKKGSIHEYKPEDYGLTKDGIREEFKEYIAKYNLLEKKEK